MVILHLLLIMVPRYLYLLVIWYPRISDLIFAGFPYVPIIGMNFDFFLFILKPYSEHSCLRASINFWMSFNYSITTMSSAYVAMFSHPICCSIHLIIGARDILNIQGLMSDPCGVPLFDLIVFSPILIVEIE